MDLHKKIIGNAVVSYFLVFVSLTFLWSKQPYLNDPFVKSHVKVAFILHLLLIGVIYIMSFSFLDSIVFFDYSLNTIITIILLLIIFAGIFFWAYKAHLGKTITLWEMLKTWNSKRALLQESSTKEITEEQRSILIFAHIPFIGYIFAARHPEFKHMKDISLLNMTVSTFSILLAWFGSISLASILMLLYTIWSVYQSIRLILADDFHSLNTEVIPTPKEKIILQKSIFSYLWNSLSKKTFTPLKKLVVEHTQRRNKKEQEIIKSLQWKKDFPLPKILAYIPMVNFIWIFFLKSQAQIHIKNGMILSLIIILIMLFVSYDSIFILLALIPLCYGIGNLDKTVYLMPYIYDIAAWIWSLFNSIFRIGKKTHELHKTEKKVSIKIWEDKKKED